MVRVNNIATVSFLTGTLASASTTNAAFRRQNAVPVINANFPDPSWIRAEDGTWYAFATNNPSITHVQVASAPAATCLWTVLQQDALPTVGRWCNGIEVWSSDVWQVADGTYVLYYAGSPYGPDLTHCIGTVTSPNPEGSFTPAATPFAYNIAQGDLIDPSGFVDVDGRYYVTYKIDGNSLGHGGSCFNSIPALVPTPIMLQEVESDGVTPIGNPVQILDRDASDGPLVEAPDIIRTAEGVFILFHSFTSLQYDVRYATATNVMGPYTKNPTPLLATGDYVVQAPGAATVAKDETKMVFHSIPISGTTVTT
jgi:beta-xylosidase